MRQTVLGLAPRTKKVEETLKFLIEKKYPVQSISLIMKEADDLPNDYLQDMSIIDEVLGSREGKGMGLVSIPGVEGVLIGGPIGALLGITASEEGYDPSADIIGPTAGGFVNALMDLGVDESIASVYEARIKKGDILIGVTVTSTKATDEVGTLFEEQKMTSPSIISE